MASEQELGAKMDWALAAAMQNNWNDTARLCEEVLGGGPTNPNMVAIARKHRALALGFEGYKAESKKRRGLLEEALQEGRRAVRAFQQSSEPPQNAAGAYKAIGSAVLFMITQEVIWNEEWPKLYPEGIAALKKAVELDPQDGEARKHLGLLGASEEIAKMRGAKTGGRLIATAACGDPFSPEVASLTGFRDEVLAKSAFGRALVQLYYHVSPPLLPRLRDPVAFGG